MTYGCEETELTDCLNVFWEGLTAKKRKVFLCRYWYFMSIREIMAECEMGKSQDRDFVMEFDYDIGKGFVRISRDSVKKTLELYVIDRSLLPEDVENPYDREIIKQYAIVSAQVDLQ